MLEKLLHEIKRRCGAEGAAVIGRDGLVISAEMPPGVMVETFSIMCATILGGAVTANSELRFSTMERVVVEATDGKLVMAGAGSKAILAVAVKPPYELNTVYSTVKQGAEKISQIL